MPLRPDWSGHLPEDLVSLPPSIHALPTDRIRISSWSDPLLDQHGHDARSAYVEQFWLPILGPTSSTNTPTPAYH